MAAEVTVICMDTSSWMRDNQSRRFLAQADAIHLYCKQKLKFHPENCVGILAMGKYAHMLVEPTRDLQKIMSNIHGAGVDSDNMRILDALKRADQSLGNNIMYKRIVVFAGGPVYWFKHGLREIGIKFKEKGVAVDVINFGDKDGPRVGWCPDWLHSYDYNRDAYKDNRIPGESKKASLEALVTAVNHNRNSHILHVPEDQLSLRDHLSRSRILSRTRWEQCCSSSFESILERQKVQIDILTQENEKLKREVEFFRTESLKFARKVQDHGVQNW